MKKYLLVFNSLHIGGIEKSIVSLLRNINYSECEVDLFLVRAEGEYLEYVPNQVNIIESDVKYDITVPFKEHFKNNNSINLFFLRILNMVITRLEKKQIIDRRKGISVNLFAKQFKKLKNNYDVAIAYGDWELEFVCKSVNASRKYFYQHVDYNGSINLYKRDRKLFKECEGILCVSEDNIRQINELFPEVNNVILLNNIIDINWMKELSFKGNKFLENNKFKILTVCRLSIEKNIDFCIEVTNILKEKCNQFIWYIVGEGPDRERIAEYIKKYNVEQYIKLIGKDSNPYGYFKSCDLYAQFSKHEGFGITIAEAKIFNKPCVTSNIDVFKEQIKWGYNGYTMEYDADKVADLIHKFMFDKSFYKKIKKNTFFIDNQKETIINKFESI